MFNYLSVLLLFLLSCVVVGWWVKGLDDKSVLILFFLSGPRPLEKEKPHLDKMENPGL